MSSSRARLQHEELRKRLTQSRPRELVVFPQGSTRILFTDGACELSGDEVLASVGGVLYSCSESGVWDTRAFSAKVRNEVIARWKAAGKKHFIGPTELLAVVTARVLWARFLDGARTFVFIDHSGVLSACITAGGDWGGGAPPHLQTYSLSRQQKSLKKRLWSISSNNKLAVQ